MSGTNVKATEFSSSIGAAHILITGAIRGVADALLNKHFDAPLHALWEALTDTAYEGPAVPLAIVQDPRCGTERLASINDLFGTSQAFDELTQYVDADFMPVATPLTLAAFAGRVDVLQALLADDVHSSQDTRRFNCLHAAAAVGDVAAIELLILKGFEVDAIDVREATPLHWRRTLAMRQPLALCSRREQRLERLIQMV